MERDVMNSYHFPRWGELPSLALYMDQVRTILDEALKPFVPDGGSTVTPTMINNYVKMKIISPPDKKKYNKEHVSMLIFLSLFKRVLSMNEIAALITELSRKLTVQEMYDIFCSEFELRLREALSGDAATQTDACPGILTAATRALAGKLVFEAMAALT